MNITLEERIQYARRHRELVGRADQARVRPKDRRFDPIEVLKASTTGRIQRLLPVKYARMKVSPFTFFRGAVSIMAADLGRLPNSGIDVQLCGDAHVRNLGSFVSADGRLVFDLNDFDETIRGPWEWDVKRMAASIALAGQESSHTRAQSKDAVEAFVESYRSSINEFSVQPILQVARYQIHREKRSGPVLTAIRQSQRSRPADLLKKFIREDARGRRTFKDARPRSWRIHGRTAKAILVSLGAYRDILAPERRHLFDLFRSIDVGFKVIGTGSVGLRDYIVLFEGNGPQDPMFLQIKQEAPSAYAKYLPNAVYSHQGRRVAEGQRATQSIADLLLGWTTIGPHHYLVRQLNERKGGIDVKELKGAGLRSLAVVAGELLARGHARSGDACMIDAYCASGTRMVKALRDFGCDYADQTEADYGAFVAAIRSGKIKIADDEK